MSYYQDARARARRRKTPWNLLLAGFVAACWAVLYAGCLLAIDRVHRHFYPGQTLFAPHQNAVAAIVAGMAALFAMLPVALFLANVTARLLPAARRALDTEAQKDPGTTFVEAQRQLRRKATWIVLPLLVIGAAATLFSWKHIEVTPMTAGKLRDFATRYTRAWSSQNPASVAAFFAEGGSLQINDRSPATGRTAIAAAAQGFMTAFPDMVVTMDSVTVQDDHAIYRWTLTGTNTGPGGTGKPVRISGYEEWTLGADGLIAESKGHFDETEYQRQLRSGAPAR